MPSVSGRITAADWWMSRGLKLRYTFNAIDDGSGYENVEVLEWWISSGLELKYSERATEAASSNGYMKVLGWWISRGLPLKYSFAAIDSASRMAKSKCWTGGKPAGWSGNGVTTCVTGHLI
ncbi:hypothetical protein BJ742DRAFT_858061 [Cladochytrium replicatum]|nr:hypothetical protein BJ742DRAFT_858061 [Cladochytrium replicatum]